MQKNQPKVKEIHACCFSLGRYCLDMRYKFIEDLVLSENVLSVLEIGGDEYFCDKDYHSADLKTGIDAQNLPYNDNSFDLVFGQDVFHIIDDPDKALAECVRVSRRDFWVFDFQPKQQMERESRTPLNRHIWTSEQLQSKIPCKTQDKTAAFHTSFLNWKGKLKYLLLPDPNWLVIHGLADLPKN